MLRSRLARNHGIERQQRSAQTSRLLTIPPEIRNMIWEHTVISQETIDISLENITRQTAAALATVCKQTRAETRALYYSSNTSMVHHSGRKTYMTRILCELFQWLRFVGPTAGAHIKDIIICYHKCYAAKEHHESQRRRMARIFTLIGRHHRTRTLRADRPRFVQGSLAFCGCHEPEIPWIYTIQAGFAHELQVVMVQGQQARRWAYLSEVYDLWSVSAASSKVEAFFKYDELF